MAKKIGDWNISAPVNPSTEYASYLERIAEEKRKIPKKPATTVQAASTQAILDRDPSRDAEWQSRPLASNWLAVSDAINPDGSIDRDKAVNARAVTAQEVAIIEDTRRKSKNTSGDAISEGASSITPEKRERAIDALVFSEPAPITEEQLEKAKELNQKVTKLAEIQKYGSQVNDEALPEDKGKLEWMGWFWQMVTKGNKK